MKVKLTSFVVLLLVALSSTCWADEWDSISQKASQLKSVRAEFTQEKHLKILAQPLISKGNFIYQAPQSLRWEYKSPVKSVMLMHNGSSKKYSQRDGELVEEPGGGFESMEMILQEITNWLNGRFTDNPIFNTSLEKDLRIIFTPKDEAVAKLISRIELKLSSLPSLMDSVTIYEGPSSFTRLTFRNAEINQKLKKSLFTEI